MLRLQSPTLGAPPASAAAHAGASMRDGGRSLTLGIGGTERDGAVKCLHAHAAFALAEPSYHLGRAMLDEAAPLFPPDRCCCA